MHCDYIHTQSKMVISNIKYNLNKMVVPWILILLLLIICIYVDCGQEVLAGIRGEDVVIPPHDLAIVQFDNRLVSDYWNISARWNRAFAKKYGHQYMFISMHESCSNGDIRLAPPWCKVKGMLAAMELNPSAKAFLYLDSDALITLNYSMSTALTYMKNYLEWDWDTKPVAFNQDGPGWACKLAFKLGYNICFNSGTVFWIRSPVSKTILQDWWQSSRFNKSSTRFRMNWREKWPWEQAQQYEMYLKHKENVMVLSFPNLPYLPWTSTKDPKSQYPTDAVEPWCFSHWPVANCFITHFCASSRQKQKMRIQYDTIEDHEEIQVFYIAESL